ncbi:hypothetical protein C408_1434 [Vibrio diabolicus E0666]|uniref:hypothetical protein n=1 Tax=Vibrio diabolicus TaxID=50719 RepID=UPI0002B7046B|nr:hypothetical protein [Vibrio diabolicus]EMD80218.1 hypothetical protein C408_1434 [Vibrio diabolicus E0666]
MNIKKILLATSALTSIYSQAAYYAVVNVPVAIGGSDQPEILVTKDDPLSTTGTYQVLNSKLLSTNTIISADGCDTELTGSTESGTFQYINDGCSDEDSITFLAEAGLMKTVKMWNYNCDYTSNEWLEAAYNGVDGLYYNPRSCSIDGSNINYLMSYDSIPATWLRGININTVGGHEGGSGELGMMMMEGGGEGGEPGLGEGSSKLILPRIQVIYGDIFIQNPSLTEIDMRNLIYVTGSVIDMQDLHMLSTLEFPNLRSYGGTVLDVVVRGAMNAFMIDIPYLRYVGLLDIRHTSITDLSNLPNLRQAYIDVGPQDFFLYQPVNKFPSKSSDFCRGVRGGDIYFSETRSQSNAMNSCSY